MYNKRFKDIYTEIGQNIRDTSTETQTILKRFANDAYQEAMDRLNFDFIDYDYTLTTTAGTKDYALPSNFNKEKYALDTTNNIYLNRVDIQQYALDNPSVVSSQGTVEAYAVLTQGCKAQPSSASVLTFVSDNATDTTQTCYVKYKDANGNEVGEAVSLNGTSSVATSGSVTKIISLSKEDTTGTVTVTSNSGAVTNAIMAPEMNDYKIKIIRLYQTPSSSIVIALPYIMDPLPMNNAGDVPLGGLAGFVVAKGTADAWRYKRKGAFAEEWDKKAEKFLAEIVWKQDNNPNQEHQVLAVAYDRETA